MVILLILIFLFTPITNVNTISATTTYSYYARILQDNVVLYKSPYMLEDYSNIYFILPKTYFVKLIDEDGQYYKVNYLEFTGYVKKECVQTIVGTPQTPYLNNVNFRIYSEQSRDLRTEPSITNGSSSQVTYIPLYTRNLTFYGKIVGDRLIEERTNIWYYCKYTADKDYYGYVYSDFCDMMTGYTENLEQVNYTQNPNFKELEPEQTTQTKLDHKATGVIIGVLTIPAIIFIIMIIKGSKLVKKERVKGKEVKDY